MLTALLAGALLLWHLRIAVAARAARKALDAQGLSDVSFRLSRLSPGRAVVEDLRWGTPEPVLTVERAEVRFAWRELLRGHVERVHVQGVRTTLSADGGRVVSPLQGRLSLLQAGLAAKKQTKPAGAAPARFSVGLATLRDARVRVVTASAAPVMSLVLEGEALGEAEERYRFSARAGDDRLFQLKAEGTVEAGVGRIAVAPELKVMDVGGLLDVARRLLPEQLARVPVAPSNCSLTVRGTCAVDAWNSVGPFELAAELGRGSVFRVSGKDAFVRFQSVRLDASGTPREAQCRVSAGVSGFSLGGAFQAAQEEKRLLSLRGTVRFRQTVTNQWVGATLDSDLPGRTVAQVLPRVLPLVPVFFSDGGTLLADAEVSRRPGGAWQGRGAFKAEALRSSVPLASGRVGVGAVRVSGTLAVADSRPGAVETRISVSEGYYNRRDLSVRGGMEAVLTAQPPYHSATGMFTGQVRESVALSRRRFAVEEGAIPFEGEAAVTGLLTGPVWQVGLRVPEFGVSADLPAARVGAKAGAEASIRYGALSAAAKGEAWVRGVEVQAYSGSNRVAEAGAERISARFSLSEFSRADFSNAVAEVALDVGGGRLAVGNEALLEELRCAVPFSVSLARGLVFRQGPRLAWRHCGAKGINAVPERFELTARREGMDADLGLRVEGSRLRVAVKASVPWADVKQSVVEVSVPETMIENDDAVAAAMRAQAKGAVFSGRVAAEAKARFLGAQPHVLGRIRMSDGRVSQGKLEVDGLSADVPFESGVFFRTIERPFVSFKGAKLGKVRLERGGLAFHLTPEELFVDRFEVGCCKGSLNAYSVHLNFKNPRDEFVVYADRIDLGEALMMVLPIKGRVEGVLYGRFPVGLDNGRVKLSTGFLYSLPGQGGKLKLEDNGQMLALLEEAGIKGEVKAPLSKALSDLDFNLFRMDLEPESGSEGMLRIKVAGKSNDKEWPAPVDLNLNVHAPLEELLNMGLEMSRK